MSAAPGGLGATTARKDVFVRGLAIIRSYIATHPVPFCVSVTGATIYSALTVASAFVLGRVTDGVIYPAFRGRLTHHALVAGVTAVVAVAVLRSASIVLRRYFAGMTSYRMQATLRKTVITHYRDLPLAFHRSRPAGELLAHTEADVQAATEVLNPVPFSIAVLFLLVFAVISLLLTDLFLAAIGLLILPVLALLNRLYGHLVEPPATRAQQRIGDVSAVAHESIDGALVVKTLGREASEVKRLDRKAAQLQRERVAVGRLRASFEPAFEALPNLGIVVLLAVGSWRQSTGAITVGTLVQFVSLFLLLAFPMRMIGFVLSDIPRAVVGRERLEGLLREKSPMTQAGARLDLPDGPLGVSACAVGFAYEAEPVLSHVSFEVAPNESVALVGSTGAGKSTLAQLLVRLADPQRGRIEVGGVDLVRIAPRELRAHVGIVFQRSFLFARSVSDNIALGTRASPRDIVEAARLAHADGFISALPDGYDTVVGERGVTLSGGQRQRVALARALVRRPRILILDDATSAVDPTIEAAILDDLRRDLLATLIVVAYRVSTISLADRVLFLEDGRITGNDSHQGLLAYGPYRTMVRAYEGRR